MEDSCYSQDIFTSSREQQLGPRKREPRTIEDISMDALEWLQQWYLSQCDGDWEHDSGITIDTLDNPGWRMEINLWGTTFSDLTLERITVERTDDNWYHAWIENNKFELACGPLNLTEGIEVFKKLTER